VVRCGYKPCGAIHRSESQGSEVRWLWSKEEQVNALKAATRFYKLRSSWLGDGGEPVSIELAEKRTQVCSTCPFNNPSRPIWEALTSTISKQLRLKMDMNLHARGESNVHICDKCDCYLPLKTWAPIQFVNTTTNMEDLPPWCWVTSESVLLPK
jgi:hypothetical protein